MVSRKSTNGKFEKIFKGKIILDQHIEDKLDIKHKVYKDDLSDALGDPYLVVMKPKQKSPLPQNRATSSGTVYELLCETESGRILFIIGRLFPDGNFYIITSYWANEQLEQIYRQESEVLKDE